MEEISGEKNKNQLHYSLPSPLVNASYILYPSLFSVSNDCIFLLLFDGDVW